MDLSEDKAIGGYQGLELPLYETNFNGPVIKTNSARSAIKLVLSSIGARKVWLPAYTCDAVVEAANEVGVTTEFYNIDSNFDIDIAMQLKKDEFILVVDYFGLCGNSVKRNTNRFGRRKTIVDCSQAFFSEPVGALATVYSPRKFFGLPDGGLLYSSDTAIRQPERRDNSSENRMTHLINRLTKSPEAAYQQYLEAEQSVSELPIQGMSQLTERLLYSIDYRRARAVRARNAQYLHEQLAKYNQLDLDISESTAPLCYPLIPNVRTASKRELINHRIFIPTYWPEVLNRVQKGSFEWNLVTNGLFLPCDQRYTEDDMDRLISLLAIK